MSELKVLRKQVKALWAIEEKLSPNERVHHQWQIVATQGKLTYLVGKGDANTFFWSKNGAEMQYGYPEQAFQVIDSWMKASYTVYAITKSRDWSKSKAISSKEDELLLITDDRYVGRYLVGVTADQRVIPLYRLEKGLRGNQWVKHKRKKKK